MREKKKLGKGLGALLSSGSAQNMSSLFSNTPSYSDKDPSLTNEGELKHIPLDLIHIFVVHHVMEDVSRYY